MNTFSYQINLVQPKTVKSKSFYGTKQPSSYDQSLRQTTSSTFYGNNLTPNYAYKNQKQLRLSAHENNGFYLSGSKSNQFLIINTPTRKNRKYSADNTNNQSQIKELIQKSSLLDSSMSMRVNKPFFNISNRSSLEQTSNLSSPLTPNSASRKLCPQDKSQKQKSNKKFQFYNPHKKNEQTVSKIKIQQILSLPVSNLQKKRSASFYQLTQAALQSNNSSTTIQISKHVPKFLQNKAKKQKPLIQDFVIGKKLGEGKFGCVYQAVHKKTGFLFALKKMKKNSIKKDKMQEQIMFEIKMQLYFDHPNILKLYGIIQEKQYINLLLEYMQQGSLFGQMTRKNILNQDQASKRMNQVLHSLEYLHKNQVVHRDIKPENIVMTMGVCKLGDFGWSAICYQRRSTMCGTIDYASPQLLKGNQYDFSIDLWCMGVLCYEMLIGRAPFFHTSRKETMKKIINSQQSQIKIPQNISSQAKDFILKFLKNDPQERMSLSQAFQHNFVLNHLDVQAQQIRKCYST